MSWYFSSVTRKASIIEQPAAPQLKKGAKKAEAKAKKKASKAQRAAELAAAAAAKVTLKDDPAKDNHGTTQTVTSAFRAENLQGVFRW